MDADSRIRRNTRLTVIIGLALAIIFMISAAIAAYILRENSIKDRSEQLSNLSLTLSEHAAQTMFSANTALQSLVDGVSSANIQSEKAYADFASKKDRFLSLQEKTSSNSIIDVATYIGRDGKVINFSRSYPPPPIDLSDRDYFQYLSTHNSSETFYSNPVRNKGNAKWVFYLAKRINNGAGEFLGVALIGVSAEVFSKFYERIGISLGEGSSLVLFKDDRTLLTRWPFVDDRIGKKVSGEALENAMKRPQLNGEVVMTDAPTSLRDNERVQRMIAFRSVSGYPLVIGVIATQELYLSSWKKSVYGILYTTILSLIFIAIGIKLLVNSYRKMVTNEHLANHDLLTGLPNRLLFTDRLQQILGLSKRSHSKFALVFIDLDNLKIINNKYGHLAGDDLLIEVSKRVQNCIRATDTVARLGGDEFVLLLPNIDSEESALAIAEKIRAALAEPHIVNGQAIAGGASLGVAIYPEHGEDETTLTKNADKAMYHAKFHGRNRVQVFTEDL